MRLSDSDEICTRITQSFLTFFDSFAILFLVYVPVSVAVGCADRLMLEIAHLRGLGNGSATE